MKRTISIILLIFLVSATALFAQDFFIKQKVHTDAHTVMGQQQPAQDEIQTIWMTDTKLAILGEQHSVIMDFNKKTVTNINHQEKSYTVMNLDQGAPASEQDAQMQQMMKSMMGNIQITVTPTGEQKVINDWKCKKYEQNMTVMGSTVKSDIWAAPEIKPPVSNYNKLHYAAYLMMPGVKSHIDKLQNEFKKIDGMVIKSETIRNVMGQEVKSWSELVEYGKKDAPASAFQVPSGYTQKEHPMGMPQ